MKIAIQFGAGSIGRGFLGQLFSQSGYETVFIEMREEIVARLNRTHSYKLEIAGKHPREIIVKKVRAVNATDTERIKEEIEKADVMATAVGADNLSLVASMVAKGMVTRADRRIEEPLNLIICENLPQASTVFKNCLLREVDAEYHKYFDSHLGLVKAVVSRMVPLVSPQLQRKDPTFIMAEEYSILPVDKKGFKGKIPLIKGMIPCENLFAYEEQKLFIHNTGHTICAHLGYLKGYRYIWQAIEDRRIFRIVKGALRETGRALIKKHNFSPPDQQAYIKDILGRFTNQALGDTVVRVGRDPIRKLGPQERLTGAARLAYQYGVIPENISRGIAAALLFDREEDKEAKKLTKMRREEGIDTVLRRVCQINPEENLAILIKKNLKELDNESGCFKGD